MLQLFSEAILTKEEEDILPLNARFQVRNGSLEARRDDVFARTPSALLELFVLLQQNPDIKGVRASTMRAVTRNLWLIDEEFRQNPRHHRLFLDILRAPVGVTHELRRMNTYEVLGRYIPSFGRIVGRMQYDLFHAYTVDAHTLFVLSNLRRWAIPRYDHELPELSRLMQQLPKPEIAYLAALFMTSPRAAVAIIRSWVRWMPRPSAWSRGCRATMRAWSPGWCAITWSSRSRRRSRTSRTLRS
ncbi:MAG: hypothetical protein WDM77_03995 [Steroidobacteraceae bacterium]